MKDRLSLKTSVAIGVAAVFFGIVRATVGNRKYWSEGQGLWDKTEDVIVNSLIGLVIWVFIMAISSGVSWLVIGKESRLNGLPHDELFIFASITVAVTSIFLLFI